mgnify:FL=1
MAHDTSIDYKKHLNFSSIHNQLGFSGKIIWLSILTCTFKLNFSHVIEIFRWVSNAFISLLDLTR